MAKKHKFIRAANALLFSGRELLFLAAALGVLIFLALPAAYRAWEQVELPPAFRLPYENRDNYYLYERCAEQAAKSFPVLFLGDSAVWGMYASNTGTWSEAINTLAGRKVAGNIAIDGLHPVAMKTLMEHYGSAIRGRTVLIYFNPLWLNSPKYDLSEDGEFTVNHPDLLPQFGGIPCYKAAFDKKIGVLLDRYVLFFALRRHWQNVFFGNKDLKQFYTEKNEFPVRRRIVPVETSHKGTDEDYSTRGIPVQHWEWVPLRKSRQWRALLETADLLSKQGNRTVILIGGINPELLDAATRTGLKNLRLEAEELLKIRGGEYLLLPELEGALYADASHPLESGYRKLAQFILEKGLLTSEVKK